MCVLVTSRIQVVISEEEMVSPELGAAQKPMPAPEGPCDLSLSLSLLSFSPASFFPFSLLPLSSSDFGFPYNYTRQL